MPSSTGWCRCLAARTILVLGLFLPGHSLSGHVDTHNTDDPPSKSIVVGADGSAEDTRPLALIIRGRVAVSPPSRHVEDSAVATAAGDEPSRHVGDSAILIDAEADTSEIYPSTAALLRRVESTGVGAGRPATPLVRTSHAATLESTAPAGASVVDADGRAPLIGDTKVSGFPSSFELMAFLKHSFTRALEPQSSNSTYEVASEEFKLVWGELMNWAFIGGVIFCFLLVDSILLSKISHVGLVIFWLAVGILYNLAVFIRDGEEMGYQWSVGYMLEWSLSIDNLFVFHLIFRHFAVPEELKHTALYCGIVGAILFRFVFFYSFGTIFGLMVWSRRVFGCFLIVSGFLVLRDEEDDFNPQDSIMVRGLRWCLGDRLRESYNTEGNSFFFYDADKTRASLLLLVVLVLELTDIVFAIDSVSAKISQIPDMYLNLSSSVVAMFGLRATFFVVDDIINSFELLKYGVCMILLFIGLELLFSPYLNIGPGGLCLMFGAIFVTCIVGSLLLQWRRGPEADDAAEDEGTPNPDKNPQDDEDPQTKSDKATEGPTTSSTRLLLPT